MSDIVGGPSLAECSVEYLNDSAEIAAGLNIDEGLWRAMRDAPSRQFTPLGNVWCGTLGSEIPIGIKKRGTRTRPERPLDEIAIAETLIRNDPTLRSHLPSFVIGVSGVGLSGRTTPGGLHLLGILTEDFSRGGALEIKEDTNHEYEYWCNTGEPNLHQRVRKALGGVVYGEAFSHMSAIVPLLGPVLIDFNEITFTDRDPVRDVRLEVARFENSAFISCPIE